MGKIALVLGILFLGFGNIGWATTYTTIGNNSWSPSTPGRSISSSDTFIINHKAKLYGFTLQNGGEIIVNNGGELKFLWSANFDNGSKITIESGGSLTMKNMTIQNYGEFIVDGILNTSNGTLENQSTGTILLNTTGEWNLFQETLKNYGLITLNNDVDWISSSMENNSSGIIILNSVLGIKQMSFSNDGNLNGYGQVNVVNGDGSFSSDGFINGCSGTSCIPPSTVGTITYLYFHTVTGGSGYSLVTGGDITNNSCSDKLIILEDSKVASDIDVGDVVVSQGVELTIDQNKTLTICNGITNDGIVLIENNASLVQTSVVDENSGSGIYRIEKKGSGSNYEYNGWSSPFNAAKLNEIFPSSNPCDVYAFDGATQSWLYDYPVNYSTSCNGNNVVFTSVHLLPGSDGVMDVGRGYFVPGVSTEVRSVEGIVNNGDIFIDVFETSLGNNPNWNLDDWNLVGNPYPCAIDLDLFYSENSGVIAGSFYFWVDDQQNGTGYHQSEDYAVYANNVGTEANGAVANKFVPAGQGFWVYALADASIKFSNAMRVTGNNADLFKSEEVGEEVFVFINITNDSTNFNQCAVGFNSEATNEFDVGSDAIKGDAGTGVAISSLIDGNPYTIQAFEEIYENESYSVPLLVTTNNASVHIIRASKFQNLESNILVHLWDKRTKVTTNLKLKDYSVYLDTGRYENRFELIFENTGTSLGVSELGEESIFSAYQNQDKIIVQIKGETALIESIVLYDLVGKEIIREVNISSGRLEIPTNTLNTGVYIVKSRLSTGEEYSTKVSVFK